MGLRTVVATPFKQRGRDRLAESDFVVGLSLDRDWYSPDQASRIVERATERGLLDRDGDELVPTFDTDSVEVPPGYTPDESLLSEQSTFEVALAELLEAGFDKQTAVAGINRTQEELAITIEAAAVVFASKQGLDVEDLAQVALASLREGKTTR